MQKAKSKSLIIIIVIVVLCAVIGITAYLNAQNASDDADGYSLTISVDREPVITYSMDELRKFPAAKVKAELSSADKEDVNGEFTGVPVHLLLTDADSTIAGNHENIIFIAGDGYSSALTADEINGNDDIIIAYEMNGEPIEHFNDGGEGPLWLVVGSDTYGNRSTKYVVKIECK